MIWLSRPDRLLSCAVVMVIITQSSKLIKTKDKWFEKINLKTNLVSELSIVLFICHSVIVTGSDT